MKRFPIVLALTLLAVGCLGPSPQEKLRAELMSMPKEEAFEKGKQLIANEKWEKGRKYLSFVYENFPGDPLSREALLRLADSYWEDGSQDALVEALFRYRDYLSRFPNRPEADYVMMRIGDVLLAQSGKPDRDQTNARKALVQYQDTLRAHPESLRHDEIIDKIKATRHQLAAHELVVGRFYCHRGFYRAAFLRLQAILESFPEFSETDQVLYWLVRSANELGKGEQAAFFRRRLDAEYPDSKWTRKAPEADLASPPEKADPAPPPTAS